MKKFLFLAVVIALSAKFVSAQTTTYPIWINGVQVTDTNASAITGAGISGTVQYIDSTKTLKFIGATIINNYTGTLLQISTKLKIEFEDSNYIQGHPCSNLAYFGDSVEFVSNPSAVLTFRHTGCLSMQSVIWANHIDFSAQGTINICYGQPGGIIRTDKPLLRTTIQNNELRFNQGNVAFIGSSRPITGYQRVVLNNRYFTYPRNTYYDTVTKALVNPLYTFDSVLVSGEYTPPYRRPVYPIKVAGTQVNILNADSITGDGITGHVSFDTLTNTLVLDHATISTVAHDGIVCDTSISIRSIGTCTVDCRNNNVVPSSKTPLVLNGASFNIVGNDSESDTLILSTYLKPVLNASDNVSFDNITLTTHAGSGLTMTSTSGTGTISFSNSAAYILAGSDRNPIKDFAQMTLTGCHIARPAGFFYNTTTRRIEDSTGATIAYTNALVIEKNHTGVQAAAKNSLALMPNPASKNLLIASESPITRLQLFDVQGRMLKNLTPNTRQTIINVRNLPNGIYTVKISGPNGMSVKHFVVRH